MRSTFARVGASKIEKKSSSSGPTVFPLVAITSPSCSSLRDVPRSRSMYFRPSAERGLMRIVVSSGIGTADVSSFSVSWAPGPFCTGSILVTWPTRKPPSRTSLPMTRRAASGVSTLIWNAGTNGRPWLA